MTQTRTSGRATLVAVNKALAARSAKFRAASASYISNGANGQLGQEIFFFDRGNKHIGVDFVPNDPRRHPGTNITYLVDRSDASPDGLAANQVVAAIRWSYRLRHGGHALRRHHARGLVSAAFFDAIAPDGSQFILAVTIPFVFVDDAGNPTDIDHNNELDYAFAETYYNDAFPWGINTSFPIDVQSVALLESGHALGQAHFGKAFRTPCEREAALRATGHHERRILQHGVRRPRHAGSERLGCRRALQHLGELPHR